MICLQTSSQFTDLSFVLQRCQDGTTGSRIQDGVIYSGLVIIYLTSLFQDPLCENMEKCKTGSHILPSQPAPCFKGTAVVNGEFKEISLKDYKGKYVVLFFYPLDL